MAWVIKEKRMGLYVALIGGEERLVRKNHAARMGNPSVAHCFLDSLRQRYSQMAYEFVMEEVK